MKQHKQSRDSAIKQLMLWIMATGQSRAEIECIKANGVGRSNTYWATQSDIAKAMGRDAMPSTHRTYLNQLVSCGVLYSLYGARKKYYAITDKGRRIAKTYGVSIMTIGKDAELPLTIDDIPF